MSRTISINRLYLLVAMLFCNTLYAADYNVAVRAHKGIDTAFKLWQPTIDELNKQLPQHRFILKPIVNLNEITLRAGKGEFEFVFTNPSSFIEIDQLHGAEALVTLNNKRSNTAQDAFGSVIFTHVRNKDILSLKDLKGKTLMAVSEPAFGGWRVAWMEMLEQGFNPHKELGSLIFSKNGIQQEVVFAVRDGLADVGVVRTDLLERMEDDGKIDLRYFRIINSKDDIKEFPFFISTMLYPEWVFATLKSTPEELVEQVKKILLSIKGDNKAAVVGKYMGWVPARDYSSVKKLMQQLKVGPYAQ